MRGGLPFIPRDMIELTFPETRVLGCLLEKEATTPEYYPLSLNAVVTACNQTTNREPVVAFDERTVQEALDGLRGKGLATVLFGAGSRVQKYRHDLPDHYDLDRRERALLCVLLLRGPQTPGELRQRTERMAGFAELAEVEAVLDGLCRGTDPLVRVIAAGLGRKERRFVHLLAGEPSVEAMPAPEPFVSSSAALQGEVAALREEVRGLREELAAFKRQFE